MHQRLEFRVVHAGIIRGIISMLICRDQSVQRLEWLLKIRAERPRREEGLGKNDEQGDAPASQSYARQYPYSVRVLQAEPDMADDLSVMDHICFAGDVEGLASSHAQTIAGRANH